MLNLSELKFNVNTDALVNAKNAIDALAAAQANLNKTTQSGTAAGGENSASAKQTKTQIDLLKKLQELYGDLANGATRWEATQLRAARSMGLPLHEVEEQLKNIRKLTKDPFDSAIGSVRSVTQHFEELQNRIKLTNDGLILTTKQMREYSRIAFEVEGKLKAQGVDTKSNDGGAQLLSQIAKEEQAYISKAIAVNKLADAERERINTSKAALQADKFLATEMQRVDAVLSELNHEHSQGTVLSEKHANSISRFANQLKAAGVSGSAATAQLEQYRGKMQQIEAIENRRAQNRLANALAPQISDVAVSIAGGMPLHLVIMQQGLQIRDLIGQSGVAADQLQKTMRDAMKNMVTSIAGTVGALGQMAGGALMDAGRGVVDFGMKVTGGSAALKAYQTEIALTAIAGEKFDRTLLSTANAVLTLSRVMAATAIGALIVGVAAATYEFIKLIGANNALARELAVTGNVFGVTTASSLQYVEGLTKVGATTREAISIVGEMSKAGNLSRTQIDLVGKAAIEMNRASGVAIEDTVKRFSDLAKDPVKALSTLQIQTGAVQPEIIKLVDELTKQGNAAKASGIAIEELGRIMGVQSAKMLGDIHPLTQAFTGLLNLIREGWTGMGNMINRAMGVVPETQKIAEQIKAINDIRSGNAGLFGLVAPKNYKENELRDLQKRLVMLDKVAQSEIDLSQTRAQAEKDRVKASEIRGSRLSVEEQRTREILKLEQDRAFLAKTGTPMSEAAYQEQLKKINEMGKSKGGGGGRSSVEKEVNFYKEIDKVYDSMISKVNELTPLEIRLNEIRSDPKFLEKSKLEREAVIAYAIEKSKEANITVQAMEAHKAYVKSQAEGIKQQEDSAKTAEERLAKMQEEAAALELAEQMQVSLAQAIEMTAIARLREQQAIEMNTGVGNPQVLAALEREIQARQKIIAEMGKKDSQEVAKGYADDLKKEFESMRDGIADSITTALFEGGKAGSQKIRQVIVNALREPISVFVTAIVNTLLGSIMGGGQGGGVLSSLLGGGGGGGGNLLSNGLGSVFGSAISSFIGNSIGGGTVGALAGGALGTMSAANVFGSIAANTAGTGISGLLATNGAFGTAAAGAGAAGGAASGIMSSLAAAGPYILAAVAIAASWKSLFGRKLKDTGIEGTFSGEDQFAGNSYEFYKGGVFRSDKTKTEALDKETTDSLGLAFKEVRQGVLDLAATIGLGADALKGFTYSVKMSTKGMSEDQIQAAWAKEFENMTEAMARRFVGTKETMQAQTLRGRQVSYDVYKRGEFWREGETALQALSRLSTAIRTVNPMLDVLGLSMYEVSLAGAGMSSKLIEVFGNAETMLGLTNAYYQNYYSEAERTAEATKQVTTALAELGINTLPMSRDAYRDLVESQDLTTEAGRKMFAELMKLAPAFAEVSSAMSEVTNGVIDEVRRLRGEIYGSSAATLEAQFAIATAAARAGDSNAMAQLPALSQALEETARLNAVTAADLAISRARLAASLTETLATQGTAIPAFANGGLYRGGLALVGERGPELINFNRGGRVHNNGETMQMLSSSDRGSATATLVAAVMRQISAVRDVNTELNMMRAETKSTAINMSKLIRLLERVTRDGESLQVTNV